MEYFRSSRSAFPDQRNELIALHHADDAVISEFWLLGTHRGRLGDLEPTGREFRCRMTAFFVFAALVAPTLARQMKTRKAAQPQPESAA